MLSKIQLYLREFAQVPWYHLLLEAFLIAWILWLLYRRYRTKKLQKSREIRLTPEEEEELLAEWHPEPLVPPYDKNHPALSPTIVTGKIGKYVTLDGIECLDMASHNYLGMAGNTEVEAAAADTIRKYGVGSCGPRAFYGTTDVHIALEKRLATFLGVEQAVSYSYAFSTIASAIPAYAKKGDVIYVDERVNYAIQRALLISKSKVEFFHHNDPNHLQQLLEKQAAEDKKHPKAAKVSRRFLVVEGIYVNGGDLCDIQKFVALKHKYKLRFFVDESVSFVTLGITGRGLLQHRNINAGDIDGIIGSFEHGLGSVGGFVAGTSYIADHQILAGLGYIFSASLPPLLATAVITALDMIDRDPDLVLRLQDNAHEVHNHFQDVHPFLRLDGDRVSPVKHLRLTSEAKVRLGLNGLGRTAAEAEKAVLRSICEKAKKAGLALTVAAYLDDSEMRGPPEPSIRLTCSNRLTTQDIKRAAKTVNQICKQIMEQSFEE